jgi:hypothetical protein
MGGVVPLGYRVENRALHVVEEHAVFVRDLYRRYLEIGSVVRLKALLDHEDARLPLRTDGTGKTIGGGLISRGHLYKILSNPIYLGRLIHKGQAHDGLHDPIVDRETWDRVQLLLAEQAQRTAGNCQNSDALLAGKLFDDRGNRMSPSHAAKGGRRWRYYVSQAVLRQFGSLALYRHTSMTAPRRAEVVGNLLRIENAADEIREALSDEMTRAFLAFPSHGDEIRTLEDSLAQLSQRAETARLSPALSTKSGKTRPGRGLAKAPGVVSPHVFCAMMIAEAWKFVRGEYPGPRNLKAAEAAEMLWGLCVLPDGHRLRRAERVTYGNRLNAWRPHFKAAMDTQLGFEADRLELRRYLSLAALREEKDRPGTQS